MKLFVVLFCTILVVAAVAAEETTEEHTEEHTEETSEHEEDQTEEAEEEPHTFHSVLMNDGRLEAILARCAKETSASKEDIELITNEEMPKHHSGFCMVNCLQRSYGLVDPRGVLNRHGILMLSEPLKRNNQMEDYNNILRLAQRCEGEVRPTGDACDNSKRLMECIVNHQKEFGFH